jgi:hypothetical protein
LKPYKVLTVKSLQRLSFRTTMSFTGPPKG